ncbi:MAG: hypothetical protein QF598_08075 [Arenicellales bacterium]|jgi:hypothetical protein|nr:hypothetical protein [Arenicellales bacterium]MDP6855449.1 hypothetical protein [Arenicellales bacterium]|tara:strand:- start:641 stop:841 length:201 start_codon:yes stop_codon:yes gene_type:complete
MTVHAYELVEKTEVLIDETQRLKDQWYASKDSIESAKQMKITAQGYIDSLEATQWRYQIVLWSCTT